MYTFIYLYSHNNIQNTLKDMTSRRRKGTATEPITEPLVTLLCVPCLREFYGRLKEGLQTEMKLSYLYNQNH
jgi:hypothetical protein